jgi:hypothetical protein
MDTGEKIHSIITIILAISTLILGMQNYSLSNRFYELEETSLRADVSILINPIEKQNWTENPNGTSFTIDGMLINEGGRSTRIAKLEVYAIFNFSNGDIYVDPISNYQHELYLERDILTSKESALFNISQNVRHFLEINPNTGEVIQIYGSRPDALRIIVWHNDGKGEKIQINEIQK